MSCMIAMLANAAQAQCSDAEQPGVELSADAAELAPMASALDAGLQRSGIRVCAGEKAAQRVARVEVSLSGTDSRTWRILVLDDVTHKRVERSIALGSVPADSRAIALALYVEELLQASWAELALARRAFLRERAAAAPDAVQREVARVVPTVAESTSAGPASGPPTAAKAPAHGDSAGESEEDAPGKRDTNGGSHEDAQRGAGRDEQPVSRGVHEDEDDEPGEDSRANEVRRGRLRVFAGALAAAHGGGMIQAGVQLGMGVRLVSWLDVGARGAYLYSPSVRATHGRIDAQSAGVAVYVEPVLRVGPVMSLRLPQAVELQRVSFRGQADRGAGGDAAVRGAVVISHGVGASLALSQSFALSVITRLCWALLPAPASDDGVLATGLSGLGGQLEILFDATF